jgi:translation initiation factor eIF-2B subunit alpha
MNTQSSLGVRAGCQLWERFFSLSRGGDMVGAFFYPSSSLTRQDFPVYKRSLITQGRSFCNATAPQCREKIAALAVDFLSDDVTVCHCLCTGIVS